MIAAIVSVTSLGLVLGLMLGFADRIFAVEVNPIIAQVEGMMPGSQCGQCGFPGCSAAATAIVAGRAPITCCPPGGKALAAALSTKLGIALDLEGMIDEGPKLAVVAEEICIGCCRCIKACPTDAIVGAAKQIHNVIREACTGCGNCTERCPTEALSLQPIPVTLPHWVWPKPALA